MVSKGQPSWFPIASGFLRKCLKSLFTGNTIARRKNPGRISFDTRILAHLRLVLWITGNRALYVRHFFKCFPKTFLLRLAMRAPICTVHLRTFLCEALRENITIIRWSVTFRISNRSERTNCAENDDDHYDSKNEWAVISHRYSLYTIRSRHEQEKSVGSRRSIFEQPEPTPSGSLPSSLRYEGHSLPPSKELAHNKHVHRNTPLRVCNRYVWIKKQAP